MSATSQPNESTKHEKKSIHNQQYYSAHKYQCFRKSLIYDVRRIGRIPRKEILKKYNLPICEFVKHLTEYTERGVPLNSHKKEQLVSLIMEYY